MASLTCLLVFSFVSSAILLYLVLNITDDVDSNTIYKRRSKRSIDYSTCHSQLCDFQDDFIRPYIDQTITEKACTPRLPTIQDCFALHSNMRTHERINLSNKFPRLLECGSTIVECLASHNVWSPNECRLQILSKDGELSTDYIESCNENTITKHFKEEDSFGFIYLVIIKNNETTEYFIRKKSGRKYYGSLLKVFVVDELSRFNFYHQYNNTLKYLKSSPSTMVDYWMYQRSLKIPQIHTILNEFSKSVNATSYNNSTDTCADVMKELIKTNNKMLNTIIENVLCSIEWIRSKHTKLEQNLKSDLSIINHILGSNVYDYDFVMFNTTADVLTDDILLDYLKQSSDVKDITYMITSLTGSHANTIHAMSVSVIQQQFNPVFLVRLSNTLVSALNKNEVQNMLNNRNTLISTYDIDATLRHVYKLIHIDSSSRLLNQSFSLLDNLPQRNCSSLLVSHPYLCICKGEKVNYVNDSLQTGLAEFITAELNHQLNQISTQSHHDPSLSLRQKYPNHNSFRTTQTRALCPRLYPYKFNRVTTHIEANTIDTCMYVYVSNINVNRTHNDYNIYACVSKTFHCGNGNYKLSRLNIPRNVVDFSSRLNENCTKEIGRLDRLLEKDLFKDNGVRHFGVLAQTQRTLSPCITILIRNYRHSVSLSVVDKCDTKVCDVEIDIYAINMVTIIPMCYKHPCKDDTNKHADMSSRLSSDSEASASESLESHEDVFEKNTVQNENFSFSVKRLKATVSPLQKVFLAAIVQNHYTSHVTSWTYRSNIHCY